MLSNNIFIVFFGCFKIPPSPHKTNAWRRGIFCKMFSNKVFFSLYLHTINMIDFKVSQFFLLLSQPVTNFLEINVWVLNTRVIGLQTNCKTVFDFFALPKNKNCILEQYQKNFEKRLFYAINFNSIEVCWLVVFDAEFSKSQIAKVCSLRSAASFGKVNQVSGKQLSFQIQSEHPRGMNKGDKFVVKKLFFVSWGCQIRQGKVRCHPKRLTCLEEFVWKLYNWRG